MFVLRIHANLCYLSTHQFISVRPAINVHHYRPQLCSENVALKRPHEFPVFIVIHIYCHSHFKPLYTVVFVFYVCVFLFFTPLSLCLHFARHFFFFSPKKAIWFNYRYSPSLLPWHWILRLPGHQWSNLGMSIKFNDGEMTKNIPNVRTVYIIAGTYHTLLATDEEHFCFRHTIDNGYFIYILYIILNSKYLSLPTGIVPDKPSKQSNPSNKFVFDTLLLFLYASSAIHQLCLGFW